MTEYNNYKIGDKFDDGSIIKVIYGCTKDIIVCKTDNGDLTWGSNTLTDPEESECLCKFNDLYHKIKFYVPKKEQEHLIAQLGRALFLALCNVYKSEQLKYFNEIEMNITHRAFARSSFIYVLSAAILTTLLTILSGIFLDSKDLNINNLQISWICPLAGAIGALASTFERSSKLRIDPFSSNSHIILQGIIRIILGLLFGLIALILVKANILLGLAKENVWLLLSISLAAGFSERLIPEALRKFETQNV